LLPQKKQKPFGNEWLFIFPYAMTTAFPAETERINLREYRVSDLEQWDDMHQDAEFRKFVVQGRLVSKEECMDMLTKRSSAKQTDYDLRCLGVKPTDEFIGYCGLRWNKELDEPELGYAIRYAFRRKGYITEASKAILKWGFGSLKLPRIMTFAEPENRASLRVIENLGFRYEKDVFLYGHTFKYYVMFSEDLKP
jgi:[ribosomal protein S5]-alanine N-acetyltransferase